MTTAAHHESSGLAFHEERWLAPSIASAPVRTPYDVSKRILDAAFALVVLVVSLPLLAILAVLIKIDTRGPVFFTQSRATLDVHCSRRGQPRLREFRMVKFRTMKTDADPSLHELHVRAYVRGELNGDPTDKALYKLPRDRRVTRVGRYLRRTSLDELPQILNVLVGHMSLVGPRPLPLYEVQQYTEEARARFLTLPGITGLWQVSGRCDLPFEKSVELDSYYVRNRSFLLDLRIIARTVPAVLSGRGAA
jgi:lipopolysaccharide/colanic/teichoic acid biosynthesis glycosyltransferase